MKTSLRSVFAIAAIIAIASPAFAADLQSVIGGSQADKLNLIHVQDLAREMKDPNAHLYIFDANPPDARTSTGWIPGAKLIAPYDKYDVATELPPDKGSDLVFYCRNTQCMASHAAAKRAINAGYTDVSVMADGIEGWKNAGMPVEMPH